MPPRARPRAFPVLALLSTLLAACGGSDAAAGEEAGNALLARHPDRILEQPGELVPDRRRQWTPHGIRGWDDRTQDAPRRGGGGYVWSRVPIAELRLPATFPDDRTIELDAFVPGGAGGPVAASVRLNGFALGEVELTPQRRTVAVAAPAPVWRSGANLLEIEVPALHRQVEDDAQSARSLALARVRYATPRHVRVDLDRRTAKLEPQTGLVYGLELLSAGELVLAGHAGGPGTLRVELVVLDERTGAVRTSAGEDVAALEKGDWRRTLRLPERRRDRLEVRIRWSSDADADLTLRRADVVERSRPARPPVVLVAVDTLSAERTSLHGYALPTTPALERLALDAVTFERCTTNCPWTLPTFLSVMTGLHPYAHWIGSARSAAGPSRPWELWALAENRWTLAETMRAAGYRTGGFVDNLWLTERFRFPQGFDSYDASAGEIEKADPSGGVKHVTRLALDWLREGDGRPPFLFLHAFDVHGPYSPDDEWKGRFLASEPEPDRFVPANGLTNVYGVVPEYVTAALYPDGAPAEVSTKLVSATYDEGVAMTDEALGKFFDDLRELGLYDDALIVVFADHGETQGQGDYLYGHGVLEESVLHVPLVVKLPGNRGAGRRVTDDVQLLDLYPTVLDVVGLARRDHLQGRSLAPVLEGGALPRAPILTQGGIHKQAAVRLGGWKLVAEFVASQCTPETALSHPAVVASLRSAGYHDIADAPMTAETLERLRARDDYGWILQTLRKAHAAPVLRLERVGVADDQLDPADEARLRVTLVQALMHLLAEVGEAHSWADAPEEAPTISAEDLETLRKLGYVGSE